MIDRFEKIELLVIFLVLSVRFLDVQRVAYYFIAIQSRVKLLQLGRLRNNDFFVKHIHRVSIEFVLRYCPGWFRALLETEVARGFILVFWTCYFTLWTYLLVWNIWKVCFQICLNGIECGKSYNAIPLLPILVQHGWI